MVGRFPVFAFPSILSIECGNQSRDTTDYVSSSLLSVESGTKTALREKPETQDTIWTAMDFSKLKTLRSCGFRHVALASALDGILYASLPGRKSAFDNERTWLAICPKAVRWNGNTMVRRHSFEGMSIIDRLVIWLTCFSHAQSSQPSDRRANENTASVSPSP